MEEFRPTLLHKYIGISAKKYNTFAKCAFEDIEATLEGKSRVHTYTTTLGVALISDTKLAALKKRLQQMEDPAKAEMLMNAINTRRREVVAQTHSAAQKKKT